MPLTLVLGPANSSKAGEVFGAYTAAAERGALLVVPTAVDARHYSRELAGQGCVLAAVLTFAGLAAEIARRAGYAERRLGRLQRERALVRSVRRAKLRAFARAAGTAGFPGAAGELVAELERSLVSPPRLAAAMRRWASEDPRRDDVARDISALYVAYASELERLGRVDGELFAWRGLDALRRAPGSWGSTPVFFYGFDDLHQLERDAIETLSRVVGVDVTVSLTYEAGRAALQARAGLVEELRPLAERVIELPAVDDYYEPGSRAALHHLERRLFEPDPGSRLDPGSTVRLLEAAGERAEAELIASEVLSLLRAGVSGDEIAVVYRSLEGSGRLLARVLERYGIPASVERSTPLGHTPLGRGLLGLARCALLPAPEARDVLDYLRSPGLLDRPEVADELEARVLRDRLRTAAQAREALGFELNEVDELARSRDPARELIRHGRRLFALPHRRRAELLDGEEQLDARALAALVGALEELEDLHERPPGGELIELLEGIEVDASDRAGAGAVVVTEPLSIRARRFRAVFVCGLQEGRFPRTPAPDPFLPDERKRELAAGSGLRLEPAEDALERERYLFYASVSRATEQVLLSYRSSDEEGNLELPSPFIADVAELFGDGWRAERRTRLLGDLVWPEGEAPTARERARADSALTAALGGAGEPPVRVLGERALRHVRHTEVVSAGALEAYAGCAFKWLVERELQPARLEPESDPLARGSYMHHVLEELLRRLGAAITPESLPRAQEILEELVAELPPSIAPGRPEPMRRAAVAAIAADLRRYLVHEAAGGCDWEPRHLELRFGFTGEEESVPALELGDGEQRVAVRGAIDRVDVDPNGRGAVVRDYKSGSARSDQQVDNWGRDGTLQVPLYMLAARELLGLDPIAGLYQPLRGGDLRARGVFLEGAVVGDELVGNDGRDRAALAAELDDAASRAVELAVRLRAGELEPRPETCSRNGCMYPGICRAT